MARRGAEVHERLALSQLQEGGDLRHADLELEGRRDAVLHLEPVVLGVLAVLVQVDEAGSHDEALRVEHRGDR